MGRKTPKPSNELRKNLSYRDFIAEDAYKIFARCKPPSFWGEKEFFFLLQCAWDISFLNNHGFNPDFDEICKANSCYLGELYSSQPDFVLLVLSKFRHMQKIWLASPEKDLTLTIAESELRRRRFMGSVRGQISSDFFDSINAITPMRVSDDESTIQEMEEFTERALSRRTDRFWNEKAEVLAAEFKVSVKVIEHVRERVRRVKPFRFPVRNEAEDTGKNSPEK